ncbi:RNA-binding domain-containing protein [Desulfopila sp. IMCC35008]|uniref:RNA-binding domain-containing protein n=1 Tax=Desulfopila sp. IMCC35008 TaxID=2653858 RepID=UPI0013D23DB9|nr:RNA-binding domain-containing protein [Desulfopila sp. IMCC35008]
MILGDLVYRGPLNIRRRLFRDIFSIVLVTVGALIALAIFQGRTVKDEISAQLISESSLLVQKRFSSYLDRFSTGLLLLAKMGSSTLLDSMEEEKLAKVFIPMMETYKELHGIVVLDQKGQGVSFARSASGNVTSIPEPAVIERLKQSELYQRAMGASEEFPVVWRSKIDFLSGMNGFAAAIRVDLLDHDSSLVVVFFIPASKIITFIGDIKTPDNVDIVFYNREGMLLSRQQLEEKRNPAAESMLVASGDVPPQTVKALSMWRKEGGDSRSVSKFVSDGITWWAGYAPLGDKSEETWISIIVPETDIVSDVKKQWVELGLMAAGILLAAVALTFGLVRKYGSQLKDLPHRQSVHTSLVENVKKFIAAGESPTLEFKSTMRTNLKTGKPGKEIELAWLKGVVAFMNSDGGIVLIGVGDDGDILGIESDGFASEDKCRLHFRNLVNNHIGADMARYVHLSICSIDEKTVLMIECERVREPVFLQIGKSEEFYVRSGPSSMKLTISQTVNYLGRR